MVKRAVNGFTGAHAFVVHPSCVRDPAGGGRVTPSSNPDADRKHFLDQQATARTPVSRHPAQLISELCCGKCRLQLFDERRETQCGCRGLRQPALCTR